LIVKCYQQIIWQKKIGTVIPLLNIFRIEKFDVFDERKNGHLFIPRTFAVPTRALAATSEVMPALRKTAVE
jgi:hypothetical protein